LLDGPPRIAPRGDVSLLATALATAPGKLPRRDAPRAPVLMRRTIALAI
jgi:hypothetical protein